MRGVLKILAGVGVAAVVAWFACQVSGCGTVDCLRSDTARFPVVEKWWK